MDLRKEPRKSIHFPITIHVNGQSVACHTINVSASGALIDTALETAPGATVQVELPQLPRLVAARVARIGAHSTAIRFQSIELGASVVGSVSAESARAHAKSNRMPNKPMAAVGGTRRR
ncbi:MAG: PilZ domain-containing protein [Pseudomonadota bacterium]